MNAQRRKALAEFIDRATAMKAEATAMAGAFESLRNDIQTEQEAEQEAYDNLPESLQNGDRGSAMQEAIDALEQALDPLNTVVDALGDLDLDDVVSNLDNARGA